MKALMYLGVGRLELQDIPEPKDDFVVKILGCGICGTDLKTFQKGHHMFPPPALLGHEFYGRVHRTPAGTGYEVGDLVALAPYYECGVCPVCGIGVGELCPQKLYIASGAFCEYVGVPESYVERGVFRLDSEDDVFTLVEPLACVLNGAEHLRIRPTSRVLVVGGGPMGALFALFFSTRGLPVAVVEPERLRRERIASWGIETYDPGTVELGTYDNVVIAVNKAELFDRYLREVADGGTVLMFSGLRKGETVSLDAYSIHYREVSLVGSFGYARAHFAQALEIIKGNTEAFSRIITHRIPLEDGGRGFELLSTGEALKVVLKP